MSRRLAGWTAVLVVAAGALWLGVLNAARFLEAPATQPSAADLAVSLGGDTGVRVLRTARLYTDGYAPYVLLTGLEASPVETRPIYLRWRAQVLTEHGIPPERIIADAEPTNSWEEAINARRLMEARGWKRVLVVSDPFHMRRLHWTWSKVFAGSGLQFSLIASAPGYWKPDAWWRDEKMGSAVITEYIKIAWYLAKY